MRKSVEKIILYSILLKDIENSFEKCQSPEARSTVNSIYNEVYSGSWLQNILNRFYSNSFSMLKLSDCNPVITQCDDLRNFSTNFSSGLSRFGGDGVNTFKTF